ncbi:MAG: F0F1 ATP synthase subunit gamma, partial [Actinobacteria bacterium]|nr:F0F1 ATP synthase subunit gamma [Actinomycetota bacterium]
YTHARNAADQDVMQEQILPIETQNLANASEESSPSANFEFEPSAEAVLTQLLPAYVETRVYHALIDSAAAEQGARRKAMKSATDNATDMVSTLTRIYNRARQGAITTEISEIVGGAAALEE